MVRQMDYMARGQHRHSCVRRVTAMIVIRIYTWRCVVAGLSTATGIVFDRVENAVPFSELTDRIQPERVLLCDPDNFEVKDAKNPFMVGQENNVDTELARKQWARLKYAYLNLGVSVDVLPSQEGFEDMVFTANQVLPFQNHENKPQVILAEMRHPSRQREIVHFEKWFQKQGYGIHKLQNTGLKFEGQGDALWHADKKLLWGGFGQRTDEKIYEEVSVIVDAPVAKLRLAHERFYHLDTCFCVLDRDSVLIYAPAFDRHGLDLIRHYFKNVIEVSDSDANNFVCNSVVIERKVLIQKGSQSSCEQLHKLGFETIEIDVSEFMKSGGGIFCLKMMVY